MVKTRRLVCDKSLSNLKKQLFTLQMREGTSIKGGLYMFNKTLMDFRNIDVRIDDVD